MNTTMTTQITEAPAPARTQRDERTAICPHCTHSQRTRANTVTCESCGLRAPISAFSGEVATRKFGAPRAFTISGSVD